MPALDRNVKVTCGICGTPVTKKHVSGHKSSYSGGTLYCPKSPNFSTKWRDDLINHIAKEHATARVKITHKCTISFKEFSGFYALREQKTSKDGIQMKSAEFDVNNFLEDIDADHRKELQYVNIFSLTLILKKEDIVFSISPCQRLTTLWLMRNWI